jgi:hypothetical protein
VDTTPSTAVAFVTALACVDTHAYSTVVLLEDAGTLGRFAVLQANEEICLAQLPGDQLDSGLSLYFLREVPRQHNADFGSLVKAG